MKHKRLVLRDYQVARLFHAAIQSDIRDFIQIIPQGTYSRQPSHATGTRYFPSHHCCGRALSTHQGKHHFLICKARLPPPHPIPKYINCGANLTDPILFPQLLYISVQL